MLISDKDQGVSRETGWAAGDELNIPPAPERVGPSLLPFLRHRRGDTWWRVGLGWLWLPLIMVVITVENWMGISQSIIWMSLGVLFIGFVTFVLLSDRLMSGD